MCGAVLMLPCAPVLCCCLCSCCRLACTLLQPCASGFVWFANKQAADALLNRSKAEPVWVRDPRTGHDLALSVKKTRRPGYSNSSSTTTSRISVGVAGMHSAGPLSSTSNSSSSYLPVLHSSSARLAAAAAGMGNSGGLDGLSMLPPNVMRLLPMQQANPALLGPAATVMLQGTSSTSTYMAHDVCEAMLDYCDSAGLNIGMPVHLQPAMAAQVGVRFLTAWSVANLMRCVLCA